jgi:PAS domain S-box-containing protein
MPQLVWSCEPDGSCDFLSRQWIEFTGVPEILHLGYGWLNAVHPDDRAELQTAWQAAVDGNANFDTEFRIRRHDGVYRWFKTRAEPVRDEDGDVVKWYGSNTDIEDLKQAEERRRALIETLAHDLKNPLAAVKAQSQVLQRRAQKGQEISLERLDMLAEMATNMADLIDEMSDASKLAAGQDLELELLRVDLVSLLQQTSATYRATTAHHTIRVESTTNSLTGQWDRARLERVFGNLLSNAIKYSPQGGEILVTVKRERNDSGAWADVSITDQGIGIPASDLEHIFQRHHRASNVGQIRGNGLGLSGAADVIRLHGGTISVTSQEGLGSTFTIRLPLSK